MKNRKFWKFLQTLLMFGLLMAGGAPLYAATGYEVSGVTFNPTVTAAQFVKVTDDLNVSWTAPAGTNPVLNYFLKINDSSTALTGTALDDATYDFKTTAAEAFSIIPKGTFDAYDSDKLRYLHIRTQYFDPNSNAIAYSDDVVSAAIRIDNVAPTGSLTLDPTSGSTTQIDVTMTPSESIKYYWLNDSATFPGGTGTDYASFPTGTVALSDGTSYGNVTIYGWFEDFAGNRSTAASASAIYEYKAPTSIQYNSSTINVDATLGLTVDAKTFYDWTIITPVSGVAEFQSGGITATNLHSVTVVGKTAGTFTVSAVPTGTSTGTLTTGTITVVQTVKPGDVNNDGVITLDDVKLAFGFFLGATSTSQQFAAANVYDDSDGNTSVSLNDVKGVFTLFLGGTL